MFAKIYPVVGVWKIKEGSCIITDPSDGMLESSFIWILRIAPSWPVVKFPNWVTDAEISYPTCKGGIAVIWAKLEVWTIALPIGLTIWAKNDFWTAAFVRGLYKPIRVKLSTLPELQEPQIVWVMFMSA